MSSVIIEEVDDIGETTSTKHDLVFNNKPRIRNNNNHHRRHDQKFIPPPQISCSKPKKKIVVKQGAMGAIGPTGPAGRSVQGEKGDPGINGGVGPTGPPGQSMNDSSIYLLTVLSTSFPNSFDADSSSLIMSFVPIIETNTQKSINDVLVTVTNASKTFNFKPNNQTGYKVKTLRVTSGRFTSTGTTDVTLTLSSAAVLNQSFYLSIVWCNN